MQKFYKFLWRFFLYKVFEPLTIRYWIRPPLYFSVHFRHPIPFGFCYYPSVIKLSLLVPTILSSPHGLQCATKCLTLRLLCPIATLHDIDDFSAFFLISAERILSLELIPSICLLIVCCNCKLQMLPLSALWFPNHKSWQVGQSIVDFSLQVHPVHSYWSGWIWVLWTHPTQLYSSERLHSLLLS